jgi:hypothetical protein
MKKIFSMGPFKSFKLSSDRIRVQVYFPEVMLWTRDFCIRLDNSLRIRWTRDYYCAGFCVLGFGLGFDYTPQKKH